MHGQQNIKIRENIFVDRICAIIMEEWCSTLTEISFYCRAEGMFVMIYIFLGKLKKCTPY